MIDDAPLRFEILGEVRVLRGGRTVDLGPAKQRAVLAVLLAQAGRPVPTHQIVDAVWGDEPPENGANVVQKYVAGLRRVLDPDRAPRTPGELIALTGNGYLLRVADGSLDADEFTAAVARATAERAAGRPAEAAEMLRAALRLWRGDALAGLTGPVFDAVRIRLDEARATAWEKWAEIEQARGQHTVLVADLPRLIHEFPLRERLRAQLMISLHSNGRQAEALAVFREARAYLLDQFGVEPGELMQDTHRRILRGETFYAEPVDPWADSDTPPPVVEPAPPVLISPAEPIPFAPAPPRRRPIVEMIFAALVPFVVCSVGSWIYFVYAGVRRKDRRQFAVAAAYGFVAIAGFLLAAVDPTPVDSEDLSVAESFGYPILFLLPLVAAVHGVILARQAGRYSGDHTLRNWGRQFAAFDPDRARRLGVGRPDLARPFTDGGLVDLNHAPGPTLARLPGIRPHQAHLIVLDRTARGPFAQVEDLVGRGLLTPKALDRIAPMVICLPPEG